MMTVEEHARIRAEERVARLRELCEDPDNEVWLMTAASNEDVKINTSRAETI